jgi:deazaflavin-dependent oxidoreductase (nitroreductase family)
MSSAKHAKVGTHKLIHVTTLGRRTGKPHVVELWFAMANGNVYLSHEGQETDWMKNIAKNPEVTFEIGGTQFKGRGRKLQDGTEEAWFGRVALYEKYYGKTTREIIEDWFSLSKLLIIEPID